MYFQLTCEKCAKRIKVREEHAGKKVKCPHCHHLQVVRMPEPDPADAPAFQIDTGPREEPGGLVIDTGGRKPRPAEQPAESQISQIVPHDSGSFTDGTEVDLARSAMWAAIGSVVFYVIIGLAYYVTKPEKKSAPSAQNVPAATAEDDAEAPPQSPAEKKPVTIGASLAKGVNDLAALFVARGWVPFVLVFFMAWSSAILVIKFRKLQRQRESMLFDLLPNDIARDITADNAVVFSRHVRGLPTKPSESFLVNRVLRGLEHFRVLKSNTEVSDRLESQADIDQNAVESSYTLLKVFIWAIPILGFIGTVIGISAAVGGFEAGMADAADTEALKESLGSVTGGLSTAFDTTLIALVMSIFIMFPASSLQKAEEDLLNWVAEYCNENLLKRLKDGKAETVGVSAAGIDDAALRKSIDAAMARHHAEIEAWSKKLEAIGTKITKEVVKGFAEVDGDIQKRQADAAKTAEQLGRTLTVLGEKTTSVQRDVAGAMQESAASLRGYLVNLNEGLASLNKVLVDLGGQQIVVERRGWSMFGRKNGK